MKAVRQARLELSGGSTPDQLKPTTQGLQELAALGAPFFAPFSPLPPLRFPKGKMPGNAEHHWCVTLGSMEPQPMGQGAVPLWCQIFRSQHRAQIPVGARPFSNSSTSSSTTLVSTTRNGRPIPTNMIVFCGKTFGLAWTTSCLK